MLDTGSSPAVVGKIEESRPAMSQRVPVEEHIESTLVKIDESIDRAEETRRKIDEQP